MSAAAATPRARPAAAPAACRARPLPEVAAPLMKSGTMTAVAMSGRSSRSVPTFRVPRSLSSTVRPALAAGLTGYREGVLAFFGARGPPAARRVGSPPAGWTSPGSWTCCGRVAWSWCSSRFPPPRRTRPHRAAAWRSRWRSASALPPGSPGCGQAEPPGDDRRPGRAGRRGRRPGRAVPRQRCGGRRLRGRGQRGRPAGRGVLARHSRRDPGRVPWGGAGDRGAGMTRRAYVLRAEQAELMLAETRRAREAETHAAALAERARIARDIHDVLAHSLAAVSVNLQAAAGLLGSETLPADNPELARAIECVGRAAALTKEGLAAARRAVLALRDEAAPLPDQLSSLAGEYAAAGDAPVEFAVTGEMRPVSAEAGLAAYRTAQEALTNARKHAPGQPVTLHLGFEPGQLTVAVVNRLPDGPPAGPLAASGAGYGLAGLRERAVLAGGSLEAGPQDGNWRVWLRIPA